MSPNHQSRSRARLSHPLNVYNQETFITVQLTQDNLEKCQKFAEDVVGTNIEQYKKRGQGNTKKIKEQIVIGKLGELAVAQALNTSAPDFAIYEKKKKSFDADMKTEDFDMHIKTQDKESGEKYGVSWVFQYSGSGYGHTDPLLTKPAARDLAIFVSVDKTSLVCTIHAAAHCVLLPKLLSLPKLIQLFGSKRVVYLESLKPEFCVDLNTLTKGKTIEN